MGEIQKNKIEYVDVVSKPVGITYEKVQVLGIYCWPHGENEKRAAFFLPRLSFNTNTDYLEKLYPGISAENDLKGKGIFTSLWKIEKFYSKVSILHPEEVLSNDFATLSAFKAWVETDSNLNEKKTKKTKMNFFRCMHLLMKRVLQNTKVRKFKILRRWHTTA